jgi:alpha-ribazole phosphatase
MRLYLIRHPQPLIGAGICYGSTDLDVADSEVTEILPALTRQCPKNALLFSSPMRRCMKLAQALAHSLRLTVQADPRLVEMDFGRWEMQSWDRIARTEIEAWANDVANYPVGGAASAMQMAQRVAAFYDEIRLAQQEAIVVSHAGTMRMLMARHEDCQPAEMIVRHIGRPVAYGEVIVLDVNDDNSI